MRNLWLRESELTYDREQKNTNPPHSAAHSISELNRFLYFLISGVSAAASWEVGVTLTLTWLSLRGDGEGPLPPVPPPAPNPNVRKERCLCCSCGGAPLPSACLYWRSKDGWWEERGFNHTDHASDKFDYIRIELFLRGFYVLLNVFLRVLCFVNQQFRGIFLILKRKK